MNLFSPAFFAFFLTTFILYYLVEPRFQRILIFLSSSIFIGIFSIPFLIYTYLFIALNFTFALMVTRNSQRPKARKIICNTGILLNIGSLVFFKYLNFIILSIGQLFNLVNFQAQLSPLKIIMPIGISYYTFQGISYILQVYRGNEPFEKNIVVFSNFFMFFPKFLAGPIEFSKNFIPQLRKTFTIYYPDFAEALKLILWGAFKKMVIADRLSMIVNGVYPNLHSNSGNILLITFLIQPLQLYCDFSGYTDIALGIGRSFGFKLTDNFNRPFFSTGVTMFWQRWHISLSSWCNEFIFKRLSFKKRKWGIWATIYAVFVTFFVIGIWHGPRWNFIILGLLQGIAINYEFFTKKIRLKIAGKLPGVFVLRSSQIITYLFFCLTLVFFFSPKVSDSIYFISNMFRNLDPTNLSIVFLNRSDKIIVLFSLLILFIVDFRREKGKDIFYEIGLWPNWQRKTVYYLICILIIYFGSPHKEFIYMQF
jgi:alginate O-acetyltransferase complex protein AlgI